MSTNDLTQRPVVAFITNYWAQLAVWQQRLLLIAAGLLVAALAWSLAPKPVRYTVLFPGKSFEQRQLMRLETALAQAGFSDYQVSQGTLLVPEKQRGLYLAALEDAPVMTEMRVERVAAEISRNRPFETAEQRRQRFQDAQKRDVEDIVRRLDGIDEAYLQYGESTTGRFARETSRSAMLAIRMEPEQPLTPQLIGSLRHIVSSHHPNLKPEAVTLIDLDSGRSFARTGTAAAATDEYLFVQQTYERLIANKLSQHLAHIEGLRVTTNVELQRTRAPAVETSPEGLWTPGKIAAWISVPMAYLEAQTNRKHVMEQMRQEALAILPPSHQGHAHSVTINSYTQPPRTDPQPALTPFWRQRSMAIPMAISFALLAALLLRTVWRDTRTPSPPPTAVPSPSPASHAPDETHRVHERLTELVRDNPKVAAETITEWVRKAA